jgi:hypothetical protein
MRSASNTWRRREAWFFQFSLKTGGGGLSVVWPKTTMTVSWFGPQNQGQRFDDLGLRITMIVSLFGPQNQVGGGLSICASKVISG